LILAVGLIAASANAPARAELSLLMFEEAGCVWCARWNAEVGPEYPITPEGLAAPLRRIDIHAPLSDDLVLTSQPVFTPTFVLVEDGTELGRIEGYPGEDFFWGLLGRLIDRAAPAD
jgi:thioredoxin-related protein